MKSRKLTYTQALVMLATLVIHVGLAAQERGSAEMQNPVSLINEPRLPDAAIPGGAAFAVTVDGSLNGTGGSPGSNVTLSPTRLNFYCSQLKFACSCTGPAKTTLTNNGARTLKITGIAIGGFNFSVTRCAFPANTCSAFLCASCPISPLAGPLPNSGLSHLKTRQRRCRSELRSGSSRCFH